MNRETKSLPAWRASRIWTWFPAILAVLGVGLLISLSSIPLVPARLGELRSRMVSNIAAANALDSELGYGGLIHNFKNSVLRPQEGKFREAALQNAKRARLRILELQASAQIDKIPIDLSAVETMVDAYEVRLQTVAGMAYLGASAREIDNAVRFDDQHALLAVHETLEQMTYHLQDQTMAVYRLILGLMIGGMLCATAAGFAVMRILNSRRALRAASQANVALDESNRKLSEANLSLQQFAGMASHDLRAPIRHLAYFADEIHDLADDPEEVRLLAARVQDRLEHMDTLVNSLLAFTKIQFKVPNRSWIESREVIEHTLEELDADIGKLGASIEVLPDQLPGILADPELLQRVFANLISNSLKYVPKGVAPHIEITSKETEQGIVFGVEDNGIGIAAEHRDQIFEPMKRLHGDGEYSGVGIGLSLVKSIVEGHAGRVWVEQGAHAGAHAGSRFCFSLPNSKRPAAEPKVLETCS